MDLREVNNEIKKQKARSYQVDWRKKNKEKVKLQNKLWNDANRKEYQRKYREA